MIRRFPRSKLVPFRAYFFFFFNDTATTEIYTLSLQDALPICQRKEAFRDKRSVQSKRHRGSSAILCLLPFRTNPCGAYQMVKYSIAHRSFAIQFLPEVDRKSTRLNSSHLGISYAVFCLKKKNG